jgi:hypothetical protein
MLRNSLILNSVQGTKDAFFSKPPTTLYHNWPFIAFDKKDFTGNLPRKINLFGLRIRGRSRYVKSNFFGRFSNRIRKRARVVSLSNTFLADNVRVRRALLVSRCFNKQFQKKFNSFLRKVGQSSFVYKKLGDDAFDHKGRLKKNFNLTQKFYRVYYHYFIRRVFRLSLNKKARWYFLKTRRKGFCFLNSLSKKNKNKVLKLRRRILLRRFAASRKNKVNLSYDKKYKRFFYFFIKKHNVFKERHKHLLQLLRSSGPKRRRKFIIKKLRQVKFFCFIKLQKVFNSGFNPFRLFFKLYKLLSLRQLRWAIRGYAFRFSGDFRNQFLRHITKFLIRHNVSFTKKKFYFRWLLDRFYTNRYSVNSTSAIQSRRFFFRYSSSSLIFSKKKIIEATQQKNLLKVKKPASTTLSNVMVGDRLAENLFGVTRKRFRILNVLPRTGHFFLSIARMLAKKGLLQRSYNFFFDYVYKNKLFFFRKAKDFLGVCNSLGSQIKVSALSLKKQSLFTLGSIRAFRAEQSLLLKQVLLVLISSFCGPAIGVNVLIDKTIVPRLFVIAPLSAYNLSSFSDYSFPFIKTPTWMFTSAGFVSTFFSKFECFVEFRPWQKSGKTHQIPVFIKNSRRRKFCFLKMFRQVFSERVEHSALNQAVSELSDFIVGGGLTLIRFTQFRESIRNIRPFIKYFKSLL